MKKFLIFLIMLLALLCLTDCSPKFSYFTTETADPQHVVDSLLQSKRIEYRYWTGFQVMGINAGDSTVISTYVLSDEGQTITVTEYGNSNLVSVSEKKRRKR